MRFSSPSPARAGFSLIEVLFALAVIGLALGATATLLGNGVLGDAATGNVDAAVALADSKLAEAGIATPLAPGETHGTFDRYRWSVAIARYTDTETEDDPAAPPLFRIAAKIARSDGVRARQIDVETLRLGPASP